MTLFSYINGLQHSTSLRIIGLMSGTSLDGLDIALCEISGSGSSTKVTLEAFVTYSYSKDWQRRLRKVSSVPVADMQELTLIHTELGRLHGRWISKALESWGVEPHTVDAIASHGQTVFHAPRSFHGLADKPHATLQIGDSDQIAVVTGIPVVGDFRQKFTAVDGEGAPLVPFVDDILYRSDAETRILLNIGGIANYTIVPRKGDAAPRRATDTGPGNTLIDALVHRHWPELRFDVDGRIAMSAEPDQTLLAVLMEDPWFKEALPRTTGPELFNIAWMQKRAEVAGLELPAPEIQVATATWFSARTIADTLKQQLPDDNAALYFSGGGMHNPALRQALATLLPDLPQRSFADIGFDPDAKEAVLFAVLANEFLVGKGFDWEKRRVHFGKLSLP